MSEKQPPVETKATSLSHAPTFPVIECFGPVVQGEGPLAGCATFFVRFGLCSFRCSWCVDPATPILMTDWTWKPMSQVKAGDLLMSARAGKYEATPVLGVQERWSDDRFRIVTESGRAIIATGDHVWRTGGRKETSRGRVTTADLKGHFLKTSKLERAPIARTDDWWRGWAKGIVLGDAHVSAGAYPKVWLRVIDEDLAIAYAEVVNRYGGHAKVKEQTRRTTAGNVVYSVVHMLRPVPWVAEGPAPSEVTGYLAGFFDAEGHTTGKQLVVTQFDPKVLDRIERLMCELGFSPSRAEKHLTINGRANVCGFLNATAPLLERKVERAFVLDTPLATEKVVSVEPVPAGDVLNVTTGTGLFMPGGALSEQCDSMFAVLPEQVKANAEYLTADEIHARLNDLRGEDFDFATTPWVTLSGGDPAIHDLTKFVRALHADRWNVAVETQGAVWKPWLASVDSLVVSPKPPSSGMVSEKHDRQYARYIEQIEASGSYPLDGTERWVAGVKARTAVKIVVFDEEDYQWAREQLPLWEHVAHAGRFLSVGTPIEDPLPSTAEARTAICDRMAWLYERLARDRAMDGVKALPQLHTLAHGHARGV